MLQGATDAIAPLLTAFCSITALYRTGPSHDQHSFRPFFLAVRCAGTKILKIICRFTNDYL
jgi:hypothetical protein